MKIVCETCATKYSIADDKVRNKVFKIRCKQCSSVIVVRATTTDAVEEVAAAPAVAEAPRDDDAVWHVVVDQEQVGPLTVAEVQARVAAGAIDGESYVWCEGFPDWLPLAEVPDLASIAAPAAASAAALRGQRNDSSVLFSLGSLTKLAANPPPRAPPAPGAAAHGGSEGSGLIDIRSMASAYLGPSRTASGASRPHVGSADDLPVFSTAAFSEPAVIIPMAGARTSNRLVYLLLGAVGLLAAIAAVLVVVVLGKQGATPVPAVAITAPDRAPMDAGTGPTVAADPIAPDAGAAPPPPTPPPRTDEDRRAATGPNVRTASTSSNRAVPAKKIDAPPPPPAPAGKCNLDETGCLLADKRPPCCSIYGGGRRITPNDKPPPPPPSDTGLPASLTKPAISAGLATVQRTAMACGASSAARGRVLIAFKITGSGAVDRATVKESPDPALGACVAAAVRKAAFARTQTGGAFQFPYRF